MKKHYLLSFLIPCVLMILLYMTVGVIGGDKNVLTVDLANQYVEFFGALKNVLGGFISPFYTFSKTLGGNFFGIITYYLMSPFNLLIVFFDRINIPIFILVINILKISFSGLTSYLFFDKTFKDNRLNLMFSIIYSLMAYNIVYSQNIMWLDGVVLLPLIFLGINRLIDKKPLLFYISLTLSIICNYYIGYMSCIASLIYFVYQSYLKNKKIEKIEIINCIKYIIICVFTSGIVLLPSFFSLLQGKANGLLGDFVPNQRFAIFDLVTRFYIGTFKNSDLLGTLPNVYISVISIVLVIYYFYNKKIDKKEKKATLVLLIVFVIGFVFSPVNTFWHTLKNPVGFPFRYSFVFDFILLIIAYKSVLNIDSIDKNFIKKFLIYGIIITLLIDKFLYNSNMYYKIIGTFVLATIYLFYLKNKKSKSISVLMILLVTCEMFLNSYMIVYNIKYQNKDKYSKFVTETGSIIDDIKKSDSDFYRIEKDYFYSSNDELLLNYSGISHFSSVYESKTNELLKNLGIFNRFYITNYNGSTPVTNSLFNIKYLLSKNDISYYEKLNNKFDINTYLNGYNLPLGFMVSDKILNLEIQENEPFTNQNNILKSMDKNIKDVFYKVDYKLELNNIKIDEDSKDLTYKKINDNYNASIKIKVNSDKKVYGYIYCDKFKKIDILVNNKSIIDVNDENNYRYNVFELSGSDEIEIVLLENEFKPKTIQFYSFDFDLFKENIDKLNSEELNITEYSSDYIKGNVSVKNDNQVLFTSIPYDKGFTVYVDGKKVDIEKSFDTLIAIKLSKGEHIVEFKYMPRGLKGGVVMSLVGIISFIIVKRKGMK